MSSNIESNDRIVIFRNGSIGNTLVAVPLIRSIRKAVPDCHIAVVVDPVGKELLKYCPYVNELILYDKRGYHRPLLRSLTFIKSLRKQKFTKAILLKRFFRNEFMAYLSGIKERYGFLTPGVKSFKLTATVPYIEGKNIIEINNDILELFNIKADGTDLELWISPEDEGLANGFIQRHALEKFAIMHPGGSTVKGRGLGIEGFIGLGKEIKKSFGLDCIVMGGVEEEEKIKRICSSDGNVFHDASGLPLLVSAQLIKHAAVFIGNDSGPSHIADALGTPGIIFYFESGEKLKQHLTKWKPRGDNYISVELSGSDDEIIRKSLTEIVRLIK